MARKDIALRVSGLHKDFLLPHDRKDSLKERLLHFSKASYERFQALDDINFEVKRGEFFGIVGRNGSGKSTLLKILGGIYQPTKGTVEVNGTLTPFIELGIGFNPELTGRENVYLNGAILGLTRKEVVAKYDEIVAFAELERFMDQKLKNYSSGMQVRLAFSIAIQAHNDILLIDEVLAVGDAAFQRKCYNVFKEIKKSGRTVVFVTHDMAAVEEYCERAILIEDSHILKEGKSYDVAREYRRLLNAVSNDHHEDADSKRFGNGQASVERAYLTTVDGKPLKHLQDTMDDCLLQVVVKFNTEVSNPIFGITIRDASGTPLFITNTKVRRIKTGSYRVGQEVTVSWPLQNIFNTGSYSISPAIAAEDGITMLDWRDDLFWLEVIRDNELPGPIFFPHTPTILRHEER